MEHHDDGEPPGIKYKIPFEQYSDSSCIASMNGFDIFRTMALVERTIPPEVVVFTVQPEQISWSMGLSHTVAVSLPHLIEAAVKEVETQERS